MTEEESYKVAENTVKNHPEITNWKPGFIGAIASHRILGEMIEQKEKENYRLRMLLWSLHKCNEKEQLNGAQHSGIYMKCIEKNIDFANDSVEKIWDAFTYQGEKT